LIPKRPLEIGLLRISFFIYFIFILFSGCKENLNKEYIPLDKLEKVHSKELKFVGSQSCVACHQEEYTDWSGSHHDEAMKVADSSSILGDFNNSIFEGDDGSSRFFIKDGEFFVNTEGPDGRKEDFKIEYTFGVFPLQQYIVAFPDGAYQTLTIAWDSEDNKWFDLQQDMNISSDEWMHWTGGAMRWNKMCADCHSTDLDKGFDPVKNSYSTTFSEINVSCEACHGPAGEHVGYYENGGTAEGPPELYMNTHLSSRELVDKCARCHSRRSQITKKFDYEGDFLDHYDPSLLIDPVYEVDGQINDEDFEYASFVQSKMYHSGVSCIDCHDVHSTKLKRTGNMLCLNCHSSNYDDYSHHFHEENTAGSSCIECHMTGKTYMGNDFRRDHSFRIPRPDQTVDYGTPNACNSCHEDKSAEWASAFIDSKFGKKRRDHFSNYLLPGAIGDNASLIHLIENDKYPEIVRATALRRLASYTLTSNEIDLITNSLHDPSGLVRNEAVRAFDERGNHELSNYIESLLSDSVRLVRISSAKYFSNNGITPRNHSDFAIAQNEFLEELEMNADFASGQMQIALYYQANLEVEQAIEAYQKALEIDNFFNTARMNLALLLYEKGDVRGAEKLYLQVIEQEPEFGYSYAMLGLLYNETGNSEKALEYLAKACEKNPFNLRAFYNYALKLQETGQHEESVKVMDKALKVHPQSEELLYVKLLGQLKSNQKKPAYNTTLKLLNLSPQNERYLQIKKSLEPGNEEAGIIIN